MSPATMTAEKAIGEIQESAEKIKSDAPQRFSEAASVGDTHRQGDIYITMLEGVPKGAKSIPNRRQLAEGSTQGSRHCIDSFDGVTMFEKKDKTQFDGPILMLEQERTIEHPEHGNVTLPPGCYGVTYQRDLDAEERERRVAD